MPAVVAFKALAVLPMLLLLRRSQAFLFCGGSNTIDPYYYGARTLRHHDFLTSSSCGRHGQRAVARRKAWERTCMLAGDGVGATDDVRQRAQDMHSTMPMDGKEDMLKNPNWEAHNRRQAAVFDSKSAFFSSPQATPPESFPSMRRIAEACRPDGDGGGDGRVVDAGCGTGALVSFLVEAGVSERDVVGVDLSIEMSGVFHERFPEAEVVTSDFVDFADRVCEEQQSPPPPADNVEGDASGEARREGEQTATKKAVGTVVFNAVFGNLWEQGVALDRAAAIVSEGGKVVISHPLGREFVSRLKEVDPTVVPHDLPEKDELERLVQFLPFHVESFESGREIYLAVLRRTPHRASEVVRYLRGEVSTGYGRGSKKLGVPTANLPESQFAENLRSIPTGVYFGWAALEEGEGGRWKCVANVGYSPTFAGQENAEKIVEGHLIGYKGEDFYGKSMRMLLAGFQRREKKFGSFPELVATITKDVGDADAALDEPRFSAFEHDVFFSESGSSAPEAWSTRDFLSAVEDATGRTDSNA